ncbi:uncharacterized protein LTR77_010664 [Saxophila tyrrhenica]|uniref:C2H2-type domain-containing protein n=1 Tax=Saxophila tyrrhenica TaxID=1690608 RepID=A0AAV9NVS9_9PEZI|nr:hypothetical protein LTR77_010664 [Saxophila tyrrhenica]
MAKREREASVSSHADGAEDLHEIRRSQSADAPTHTTKYASVEPSDQQPSIMRCALPPHKLLSFKTCADCKANFPTSRFLELHIAENHDPIVAGKRDAGEKTYACFVEGCDKVCGEWQKRRSHLVDKHAFPKNYDFLVVDHGIDRQRSLLRPGVDEHGHRKSSRERARSSSNATEATQSTEATSVDQPDDVGSQEKMSVDARPSDTTDKGREAKQSSSATQPDVDALASSLSSLSMVPRSVTFGRRKGRSGLARS